MAHAPGRPPHHASRQVTNYTLHGCFGAAVATLDVPAACSGRGGCAGRVRIAEGRFLIGSLFTGALVRRKHTSTVLWLSILGFAIVAAACGGSGDSGLTVTSSDGNATLIVAEGSLPDGVSIDDIQVDWVQGLSDDAGAPLSSVRLSPSGLVLSEAAVLQVEIPDTVEQLLAVHSNSEGFEIVEVGVEPAGDALVAIVELESFSFLTLYDVDGFLIDADASPALVGVGEFQNVATEIQIRDGTILLWINVGTFFEQKFQQFEFRIQDMATSLLPPNASWWNGKKLSEEWDPRRVNADVKERDEFIATSASSMCVEPNTSTPQAETRLILGMRLVNKGPVVDAKNLELLDAFGTTVNLAKVEGISVSDLVGLVPFSMRVDETILGAVTVTRRFESECVALPSGGESTTTTSATLPPDEEKTSLNLVGTAGNITCENPDTALDPALTIAGVTFEQVGEEIVVTIRFEGDAEAYENSTTDTFPVAVQFRLKEDTDGYPEVFFGDKGKPKVSGGLMQVANHEFSGNTLTFRVKGRTLRDVQGVQVSTFSYDGGSCNDLLFSDGYND
ncbi:hypothetical protein MNBD_ACTINO02-2317 [hydrothermal vent metagenome]|uniref:Uncharacterized protein n=1 Tax=hydrothermal vent metagenome TaxID=652676 RepID=A0A3B0TQ99_9ZZZZ